MLWMARLSVRDGPPVCGSGPQNDHPPVSRQALEHPQRVDGEVLREEELDVGQDGRVPIVSGHTVVQKLTDSQHSLPPRQAKKSLTDL